VDPVPDPGRPKMLFAGLTYVTVLIKNNLFVIKKNLGFDPDPD
jgi:hypothetical protein